jgi:UDP-4-amino-4,6-dideoxy-N-acetyl-beta-L-altrosamine transaminase
MTPAPRPGPLPYGRQTIDEADIAAVEAVLRSDFLTTGPQVEDFEADFAAVVGASHAVACSNGTAALHLALLAQGVAKGDVCIVPSITFLATANAVRHVGAEVAFADVDPTSGLMTPDSLSQALSRADGRRVGAVLPVHLRGEVCDLPALKSLAESTGAVLIEDAAHALGSVGPGGVVGSNACAPLTCFSFHPVKTICTGEGGMVTTSDAALAQRLRSFRSHGMTYPAGADPWVYEMHAPGFNYRLPDILCALGRSQLSKLPAFARRRKDLVALYIEQLALLVPAARPAVSPVGSDATPHLMTVLIDFEALGVTRAVAMAALKERGVGSQVHYIPVHSQPYYRERYGELDLPGSDAWYARCLSLPLFPAMTDEDVLRVVDALAQVLA